MLCFRDAHKFFGLLGDRPLRAGLRVEASVDDLCRGLGEIGCVVKREPIERGWPDKSSLSVMRTLGSPWSDLGEQGDEILSEPLARDVSRVLDCRAFRYQYAAPRGELRHSLYACGELMENLAIAPAPSNNIAWSFRDGSPHIDTVETDPARYIDELFRALRMREWGIGVPELADLRLPFPPTIIVEGYFLRLTAAKR